MYELGKEFGCLWRNGLEETWEAVGGAQGDHSEELRRPDATGNVHSGVSAGKDSDGMGILPRTRQVISLAIAQQRTRLYFSMPDSTYKENQEERLVYLTETMS